MSDQTDIVARARAVVAHTGGYDPGPHGDPTILADLLPYLDRLRSKPQGWQAGFAAGLEAAATRIAEARPGDHLAAHIRAIPVPQEPTPAPPKGMMDDPVVRAVAEAIYQSVKPYTNNAPAFDALLEIYQLGHKLTAQAAIRAMEAAQWQDIATAPKDGTEFLALNNNASIVGYRVVYFDDEARGEHCWHVEDAGKGFNHHRDFFTHWRPLPAPPAKEKS